jgi:hypothetical protein
MMKPVKKDNENGKRKMCMFTWFVSDNFFSCSGAASQQFSGQFVPGQPQPFGGRGYEPFPPAFQGLFRV